MGVMKFPEYLVDTYRRHQDTESCTHSAQSMSTKSVRFADNHTTVYDGNVANALHATTNHLSLDLNHNEELLRKVMFNICGGFIDNDEYEYACDNEFPKVIEGSETETDTEIGSVVSESSNKSELNTSWNKTKKSSSSSAAAKYPESAVGRNILKRVSYKKDKVVKRKNDENNNFVFLKSEDLKVPKWKDENVFNRTEVLALPKPMPQGYEEEKEATYWISKKPPPIPKDGYTVSIATPRVEELAKPMYNKFGEFTGGRHCLWDNEMDQPKKLFKNPDLVDWARLATPKPKYAEVIKDTGNLPPSSALKYEATKRLHQLSVPKKKIDCGSYYLWLWNKKPDDAEKLHPIKQLSINKTDVEDARILLRCDLDFTEGKIIERKIRNILPTIQYAFKKKARAVIIISHCGEPNGNAVPELSLERLMDRLTEALPDNHVVFLDNCVGAEAIALCEDPEKGHVFLLENLRFHPEELGYSINDEGVKVPCSKESVEAFRSTLLSFGDVYVNDAFTVLNEETATTTIRDNKKEKCYGLHIQQEIGIYKHFVLNTRRRRLIAIIGGSYNEVADVISSLMGHAAELILGGEIALMFLHTVRGLDVGETECSPYHMKKIRDMMTRARDTNTIINLPADVVLEHVDYPGVYFTGHVKDGIDDYYKAMDIGPMTRECYHNVMMSADLLIWYGRMGELHDGTSTIANSFGTAYAEYEIETYLLDNNTICYFNMYCPNGQAAHLTEKSEVTMAFLHRKIPKSISSLSPWRRKMKKRPPRVPQISTKPVSYESPCMKMCNAMDRLTIDELELANKKVIIRCDLSVPLEYNKVMDNFRLRMAVPSIRYALQCGAHAVIIISSMGNQYGRKSETNSLKPAAAHLARFLHITDKAVVFVPEPTLAKVQAALKNCYPGTVIVVENINFREEELLFRDNIENQTLKDRERVAQFCMELSQMGDVFVNDTFNNLHEPSASTCGIMLQKRACGFLLKNELRYLSQAFNSPPRPILVILGGQYSKDKITALKSLIREIDEVIITGSLAMTFLKVINKMPIGNCPNYPELETEVPVILALAAANKVRMLYPVDFVVTDESAEITKQSSASVGVIADWHVADIGDNSCSLFKQAAKRNKMILWHGVAGIVEDSRFRKGTQTLLDVITEMTNDPEAGVVSILGGNSTLSFAQNINPDSAGVSHMTTGGLTCAALVMDRCLAPIRLLSAGNIRQSLSKLTVKDIDITEMSVLLRAHLDIEKAPNDNTPLHESIAVKLLIPTITMLQKRGARCITIVGSLGNPQGQKDEELSLLPLKNALEKKLKQEITFFENGVAGASVSSGSAGKLFMLENLSFHPEEQGWEQDEGGERVKTSYSLVDEYRKKLGSLGEVFVNDSLSSLSCCDSSAVGVSAKIKCAGPTLKSELMKFIKFLNKNALPLVAVMGSCSGSTDTAHKLGLLYDLLDQVIEVVLTGDLAYTYIRVSTPAAKLEDTPADPELLKLWPRIIQKAKLNGIKLHTPVDFYIDDRVEQVVIPEVQPTPIKAQSVMLADQPSEEGVEDIKMVPVLKTLAEGMGKGRMAMDLGPASVEKFREVLMNAGGIVLMGPMGEFEQKDYDEGSKAMLELIREAMTENNILSVACGLDTYRMLEMLDKMDVVSQCCLDTKSCVNLIRNMLLPGLEHLDPAPPKPLNKLSIETFNISGKRVVLRLDLNIPIVSNVTLDVSKIQQALPTIRFLLNKGAKSVVLTGHRGQPHGYKNAYLSLEPLAAEFARFLEMTVNFLPYPCSAKAREILEDPTPGSVFLTENLKFYPAEEGKDIPSRASLQARAATQRKSLDATKEVQEGEGGESLTEDKKESNYSLRVSSEGGEYVGEDGEEKEKEEGGRGSDGEQLGEEVVESGEEEEDNEEDLNDEFIMFTDPENLDRLMYEKMAPKSLRKYREELSGLGDVFVNDDVTDLQSESLTSVTGVGFRKKMCGLMVKEFLTKSDLDDIYKYKAVASLSPAPKEGEIDDLVLQ